MGLETPAALWGLAALAILALLSRWRREVPERLVPSLRLWKPIPERLGPVEPRRARRATLLMILQMAAATALVAALAEPFVERDAPPPRRLVLGIDTSARMAAGDRLKEARRLADRLVAALHPDDAVEIHTADRVERRRAPLPEPGDRSVAIGPLAARVAAVRGEPGEQVRRLLITDRRVEVPEGVELAVVGSFIPNAGIVDASVSDGTLAVTVRAEGVGPVTVRAGSATATGSVEGERTFFLTAPAGPAEIFLEPSDGFDRDNRVRLERADEGTLRVELSGGRKRALEEVLKADPRVVFGAGGVRVRVGEAIEVVRGDFPPPRVGEPSAPGALILADHPVLQEVVAEELGSPAAREVGPGQWLIRDGGRVVCAAEPGRVICGLEVDGSDWSRRLSFPIFWHNVLTYVAGEGGGGGWKAAGLLDREQSTIPRDGPGPAPPLDTGTGRRKLPLGRACLWAAGVLMMAAWVAQRKP